MDLKHFGFAMFLMYKLKVLLFFYNKMLKTEKLA